MGLHDIRARGWTNVVLWYQAVNQRGGRRHLFSIPVFRADMTNWRERNQHTRNMWYRRRWFENEYLAITHFPANNFPPNTRRLCNSKQIAREWYRNWSWGHDGSELPASDTVRPRGYCAKCWKLWEANPRVLRRTAELTLNYAGLQRDRDLQATALLWQAQLDQR